MIEHLSESHGAAFGFKVIGTLTADDITSLSGQIENVIVANKKPIGLLADENAGAKIGHMAPRERRHMAV